MNSHSSASTYQRKMLAAFRGFIERYGSGESLRYLDVGCGDGVATMSYLGALLERGVSLRTCTLVDPDAVARDLAATRVAPVMDSGELSSVPQLSQELLDENRFDLIVLSYVVAHFDPRILHELVRALRPRGCVVVMRGHSDTPPVQLDSVLTSLQRNEQLQVQRKLVPIEDRVRHEFISIVRRYDPPFKTSKLS